MGLTSDYYFKFPTTSPKFISIPKASDIIAHLSSTLGIK